MKKLFIFFSLLHFATSALADVSAREVFVAINNRLELMEEVALYKAHHHIAIEDVERENTVVENAKHAAGNLGLEPEQVEDFFRAQIAVAKAIQYRYRADFLAQPVKRDPKDLQQQLRPRLLVLGDQIIQYLSDYVKLHGRFQQSQFDEFVSVIAVNHVSPSDKKLLFDALLKVTPLSD